MDDTIKDKFENYISNYIKKDHINHAYLLETNVENKLSLAELIAEYSDTKVIFDLPSEAEEKGYSKAQRAILNPEKIQQEGWKAQFDIRRGIERTLTLLKVILDV